MILKANLNMMRLFNDDARILQWKKTIYIFQYVQLCICYSNLKVYTTIMCITWDSFGSGLTHIITMDLHQKEIQGFFDIPVENLRASPFLIDYIERLVSD